MNREEKFKLGEKWALIGVYGNLLLTAAKAFAGIVAGSHAMIADAIHSGTDIVSSAAVFISLRIAKKPADEGHPYGHGKAEAIATFFVAILLLGAGTEIIWNSVYVILHHAYKEPGIIALYAAILSIVVKELMFQFTYKVGKQINSAATIANAWEHRSDVVASIAALLGIIGARMRYPVLDPIAGALVALLILRMSLSITKDAITQIMDTSSEKHILEKITEVALEVEGVKNVHDVRSRSSGPYIIVDLNLCVDCSLSINEAHQISDNAREAIMSSINDVSDVLVHIDPYMPSCKTKSI
jgi:cation diffusion facilitator family transporter